ncbi:DUF924 family protein [Streptococcus plurextorum]|uniref:DUF924 family protein n=1 Tax=Streptococcus plurextorum TaxID=456876 RepID=UPI0003FBA755|nr:DUF924 family protein [Streptococcus plurextorum]
MIVQAQEVLAFWFSEDNRHRHFDKSDAFDQEIRSRFFNTWQAAKAGELFSWRQSLAGRIAEIIVLDQFSRNLFRASKEAFEQDALALVLAQEAIKEAGFWELDEDLKIAGLMPFMHSESRLIHEEALVLFRRLGNAKKLYYEEKHKAIIERFGRFPHRNNCLGRSSSLEEIQYLKAEAPHF